MPSDSDLRTIADGLQHAVLPSAPVLLEIIARAAELLSLEPTLLRIAGECAVIGDIHGQYYDFLNIWGMVESEKALFLGDYVDRGYNSVEIIIHILILKIASPDRVYLLRGNHENRYQTNVYGFREECVRKYDMHVYWRICDLFRYIPLAAVINDHYLGIHGGIVPSMDLSDLERVDRVEEYPDMGGVMWSDPSEELEGFALSHRGAGYRFGERAVQQFLERNSLGVLVRSHQLVMNGVKEEFGGRCITVWSAPNYCYKCRNIGAIMVIEGTRHRFVYFEAVAEQYREE